MKKLIAVTIIAGAIGASGYVATAAGTTKANAPLGVTFTPTAIAYSYANDLGPMTVTTGAHAIYNLQNINLGWPVYNQLTWENDASEIPAHSTVTVNPPSGAFYINGYAPLALPLRYSNKPSGGKEYETIAMGSFTIGPYGCNPPTQPGC